MTAEGEITQWLERVRNGDARAANELSQALYQRLYAHASQATNQLDLHGSMHASVLVNEVFLKLLSSKTFERAENRSYLYAAAARAMREVLADYFAKRQTLKRTPPGRRIMLDDILDYFEDQKINFPELTEALVELEAESPRKAAVLHSRYFLGDTMQQAADRLGISLCTAESDLRIAKLWLYRKLREC